MFLTWSDTNRAVQSLKKLCIYEAVGLYYLCSESTGADLFRVSSRLITAFLMSTYNLCLETKYGK